MIPLNLVIAHATLRSRTPLPGAETLIAAHIDQARAYGERFSAYDAEKAQEWLDARRLARQQQRRATR